MGRWPALALVLGLCTPACISLPGGGGSAADLRPDRPTQAETTESTTSHLAERLQCGRWYLWASYVRLRDRGCGDEDLRLLIMDFDEAANNNYFNELDRYHRARQAVGRRAGSAACLGVGKR